MGPSHMARTLSVGHVRAASMMASTSWDLHHEGVIYRVIRLLGGQGALAELRLHILEEPLHGVQLRRVLRRVQQERPHSKHGLGE